MKKYLITLIILLVAVKAQATTYYVDDDTGNDSRTCLTDDTNATTGRCATIQHVIDIPVVAGDTVIVKDGTYTDTDYDHKIIYFSSKNGTSGSPITVRAENKYGAILDGQLTHHTEVTGWSLHSGDIYKATVTTSPSVDAPVNYVLFGPPCNTYINGVRQECSAQGLNYDAVRKNNIGELSANGNWYYDDGTNTLYYKGYNSGNYYLATDGVKSGVVFSGSSYIVLDGFTIKNARKNGVDFLSSSNHITVQNSIIYDISRLKWPCYQPGLRYGNSGVGSDSTASYITINKNIIHDIGRLKVGTAGGGCDSAEENLDHGFYTYGDYFDITSNLIYNCVVGWPIQMQTGSSTDPIIGYNILNNTFYGRNTKRDGHILFWQLQHGHRIENNISYSPGAYFVANGQGFNYQGRDSISPPLDSGTGNVSEGVLTDGTKLWVTNQWYQPPVRGSYFPYKLKIGSTTYNITGNSATTITVSGTPPTGNQSYTIVGSHIIRNNLVYGDTGIKLAEFGTDDSGVGVGTLNTYTPTTTTQTWTANKWAGYYKLKDANGMVYTITSNTTTALTVSGTPASGSYVIYRFDYPPGQPWRSTIENEDAVFTKFEDNIVGSTAGFDPKFVSLSTPDFHLMSDSPAIDAANDVGLTSDLEGNTMVGAAWDLGAYEYGQAVASDNQTPSVPGSLTATVSGSTPQTQINLDWADSTDDFTAPGDGLGQVSDYDIYRCSGVSCTVPAAGTTPHASVGGQPALSNYADSGLTASTSYSYKVRARDAAGNASAQSTIATAVTGADPPVTENLVSNGGFESGTTGWTLYSDAAGETLSAATSPSPHGGTYLGKSYLPNAGTNVQLYQYGIALDAETNYRLSFWAYSNTGHNMDVHIHKHGSPYNSYGLNQTNIDLTAGWAYYTYDFTTIDFGVTSVNDARLRFWFAPYDVAGDEYYIDDITLENIEPATPTELPAQIRNGGKAPFSGGFKTW